VTGSIKGLRAGNGELRAARLSAIKSDILNNLGQHSLSIHGIASRHGVSVRYIHRLFAVDSMSFDRFVLLQRLSAVHRMLNDERSASRTIGAIAFEMGFGNLPHFERAFKRHYRMKPSDVRKAAGG
jgi:AraC-like DNA-binding protein